VTLVELVVFIVIVAVAIAGVLGALNIATRSSADPMMQKQALAIAESLLEEIELMPFTCRDPDDPTAGDAVAAVSGNNCTAGGTQETMGPEAAQSESRYSPTNPFDNMNDYNGFTMVGISDITGTAIPNLGNYTATVAIATGALTVAPPDASLLITVTVTGPANTRVVLQGIRARYAPTSLP
jgi:MSHA pilin protein MshD